MKKTVLSSLVSFMLASSFATQAATVELASVIATGNKKGDEIVSVQSNSKSMAVSNSKKGMVALYTISNPLKPALKYQVELDLAEGEQITSVAMHPTHSYFLVAIQAASQTGNGRIEIRHSDSGKLLHHVASGVGPDAVVIDPTGQYALIPNEAEAFLYNQADKSFFSPEGSLTLVTLSASPSDITAQQISLSDYTNTEGFVNAEHKRFIEREIDWNGDGKITEEDVDLDGNGTISENKLTIGSFRGEKVRVEEEDGELFLFPLFDNKPDVLEPEYPVFSADGKHVWVTLQENNGVLMVDTASAKITHVFGLGITRHAADLDDNQNTDFSDTLTALREPDGVALTTDNKYLVTADEGDTDPKASKTKNGPTGGGRTISLFDAQSGAFIADTGNQIDLMAHEKGIYPDSRSDNKGSEPEMLVIFSDDGTDYAVVGLERANAVALVSLANPNKPQVLDIASIDPKAEDGKVAPEGIAHYLDPQSGTHYIYTANEKNGTLAVFKLNL